MINDKTSEHINELIEKGYIIIAESQYLFKMKYIENRKKEPELICGPDLSCDGDIFEKGSEILVAKNIRQPRSYADICIEETYSFIKTDPFSASLKIDGNKMVLFNYNHEWMKIIYDEFSFFDEPVANTSIPETGCAKKMLQIKTGNCNPSYSFIFIASKEDGYYYLIGITNKHTEMALSDHRFHFVADSIVNQSLPDDINDTDWTGMRRPRTFQFRTLEQAVQWIRENQQTLILRYNNGFMLEVTPESVKIPKGFLSELLRNDDEN